MLTHRAWARATVLAVGMGGPVLACASIVDFDLVTFAPPLGDAGSVEADAGADAGDLRDAKSGANGPVDDSDFCRGKAGATFCRQFDDGTEPSRGDTVYEALGEVTVHTDDPDAPSKPGVLRAVTSGNDGTARFAGGPFPMREARLEFRVKLAPPSGPRFVAALRVDSCAFYVSTNMVTPEVFPDDGGAATVGESFPLTQPIPQGAWTPVEIVVKRSSEAGLSIRVFVNGSPSVDASVSRCTLAVPSFGALLALGIPSGPPAGVAYDDVVLMPPN